MEDILGYVSLALLGLLAFTVLQGMFFGAVRGAKRSFIRAITMTIFMVAALFVTPIISKTILGMDIKVMDGKNLNEYIVSIFEKDEGTLGNAYSTMPEIRALVEALPLAILNIAVFLSLYFVCKVLSWILYAIVARSAAPKKDDNDEKIKHSRLLGAFMGVITALVFFTFIMLPINGALFTLNEIDSYVSASAHTTTQQTNGFTDVIFEPINEVNEAINKSTYGTIASLTQIQRVSNMGLNMLVDVKFSMENDDKTQSVNILSDGVNALKLAYDADVLVGSFDKPGNIGDKLKGNYETIKALINNTFDMSLLKLFLDSPNLMNFVRGEGWLDNFSIPGASEEVKQEVIQDASNTEAQLANQVRFTNSLYVALEEVNSEFKDDLLRLVEILQLVFDDHKVGNETYNVYEAFDNFLDAISSKHDPEGTLTREQKRVRAERINGAGRLLKDALTIPTFDGKSLSDKLFQNIADLKIFKDMLFSESNPDLHRMFIMANLKVAYENSAVEDFGAVMGSIGDTLVDFCDNASDIIEIMRVSDEKEIISKLGDLELTAKIGKLLESVTNKTESGKLGLSGIMRGLILKSGVFDIVDGTTDEVDDENLPNPFMGYSLDDEGGDDDDNSGTVTEEDKALDAQILDAIKEKFDEIKSRLALPVTDDDYNIEWSTELPNFIDDISKAVVKAASKELDKALENTGIKVNLGDEEKAAEVIATVVEALEMFEDVINKVQDGQDLSEMSADDLLLMFGNAKTEEGETATSLDQSAGELFEMLAGSEITIELEDEELKEQILEAISPDEDGNMSEVAQYLTEDQIDAIKKLFGLGGTLPPLPI